MPLPEALKARLAQRGIIAKGQQDESREFVEEVIAEDYSGDNHRGGYSRNKDEVEVPTRWFPKCVNKINQFHTCSDYCEKRYGLVPFTGTQDTETERKRLRMLRHYPLPDGWKEIADPESNRYYYCNTSTGQISWLSPAHPKAKVYSASGQKLHDRPSSSSHHRSGHDRGDDRRKRRSDEHEDRSYRSRDRRDRSPDRDRDGRR